MASSPAPIPARMQAICDGLDAPHDRRRCCANGWPACPIPSPRRSAQAGFRYDVSILQAEFALTQVLDRPHDGAHPLRGDHPREPRSGPPRSGATDLRPPRDQADHSALPFPHPRDHPGRDALALRGLQAAAHQAVPQGGTGPAHRDHHQRHARLRHRQAAAQPARAAGGRLCKPTDVCSTSNNSATIASSARTPSAR